MWRYTLKDLHPDDDPETWAKALAAEGWQMWIPGNHGAELTLQGRTFRRYSLRRWTGTSDPPSDKEAG